MFIFRYLQGSVVVAAALLMSACGGGGGSGIVTGPGVSPPVQQVERLSPSLAPKPTTVVNSSLNGELQAETFQAIGYITDATSDVNQRLQFVTLLEESSLGEKIKFRINGQENVTVSFNEGGYNKSATFSPGDRGPISNATFFNASSDLNLYRITDTGYRDIYSSPLPTEASVFDYLNIGNWNHYERGDLTNSLKAVFLWGIRTQVSSLPTSGQASYKTRLIGEGVAGMDAYFLTGDFTTNVDFRTGKLSANIAAMKRSGGFYGNWYVVSLDMQIEEGNTSFRGVAKAENNVLTGTAEGSFYGPNGVELGGIFTISSGNPVSVGGGEKAQAIFFGKKN